MHGSRGWLLEHSKVVWIEAATIRDEDEDDEQICSLLLFISVFFCFGIGCLEVESKVDVSIPKCITFDGIDRFHHSESGEF